MRSYGGEAHRYAKIPHTAAIFAASVSEGRAQKCCGQPFSSSGGHFGTADQLLGKHRNAMFYLLKHHNAIVKMIAKSA